MDTSPILIAGGGIAGLSAALALGPHQVSILEQAPAFTTAGAGLQLGPNAVRALQALGAWDAVEPYTSKPKAIEFRDGHSGKLLKRLELGQAFAKRYGANYHVAHRSGLHAGLLEAVRGRTNIAIALGQTLQQVELGASEVQARVKGKNIRAPALIVADGVQSTLRQQFFPNSKAVEAAAIFHRALIPTPSFTPECVVVWMLPHGHVVHYNIGQPKLLNLVAVTPHAVAPTSFFAHVAPALADTLSAAMPHFTTWPVRYVQPLKSWTIGSALLVGDAAHGTLPYMAQGAAMALEDAACLHQVTLRSHSLHHAFAETASRRLARTTRLHHTTITTGKAYHAQGLARQLRNVAISHCPDFMFWQNLDWLYAK